MLFGGRHRKNRGKPILAETRVFWFLFEKSRKNDEPASFHCPKPSTAKGQRFLTTQCVKHVAKRGFSVAGSKSHLLSAVVIGLILLSLVASASSQGSQDEAASAISKAEQAITLGYEAVLDAERAGSNVTSLLAGLNDAAALLVDARRAFNASRFEEATGLAELASAAADITRSDAKKLEIETAEANATRRTWFLIASFVAVPLVLVASFLGYRYFKKWYHQRPSKMKLEVEEAWTSRTTERFS